MIALGAGMVAVAVATKLLGWIGVPVVGLVIGLTRAGKKPVLTGAKAGALGWGALLLWGMSRGPVMPLAAILGEVFGGLPSILVIAVTLLFPALLAGAAAGVGSAIRAMGSDGA